MEAAQTGNAFGGSQALCGQFPLVPDVEKHDGNHQENLVGGVPELHGHAVETTHHVFVVETAYRAGEDGGNKTPDPFVVRKGNALFFAHARVENQASERHDGSRPLPGIHAFAKDDESSDKHEHGLRCLDGCRDGDGQTLDGIIGQCPREQHDTRFQQDIEVFHAAKLAHIKQIARHHVRTKTRQNKSRKEGQSATNTRQEENRQHRVVSHRHFLENFVTTQEQRRGHRTQQPHIYLKIYYLLTS